MSSASEKKVAKRDAPANGRDDDDSSPKRAKPEVPEFPLNEDLFEQATRERLHSEFTKSLPYTHVVLKDVCHRGSLVLARDELINNVEAKFKETDLFKVFQTGDLANIDGLEPELAAKLPTLLKIRNAIYSERFRNLVEDVVGIERGSLTDKVDCSSNVYAHGGHLLCHDDVIGTRCVSYILYLTDPERQWTAGDGGALELFPLKDGDSGNPDVIPTTTLLPHFNSLAMFTVQPGRSFHSVQEVYSDSNPRLSISGWFHRTTPPDGADQASLNQLKSGAAAAAVQPLSHGLSADDDAYTAEERTLLEKWINPQYLDRKATRMLVARWEADSSVQLRSFLREDVAAEIMCAIPDADTRDGVGNGRVPAYAAGLAAGWCAVGPCHKRRHLVYDPDGPAAAAQGDAARDSPADAGQAGAGAAAVGAKLRAALHELLLSAAFAKWLLKITDLVVLEAAAEVRRFRPGLDYTVAHFGSMAAKPQLDVTLCFVDDGDEEKAAAWASDELGGFQCYILADEEANTAAETYRADAEDDTLISCSASSNTLNILLRDSTLMKFVKYVNHDAPSSRFDIAVEYGVDLSDEEIRDAAKEDAN